MGKLACAGFRARIYALRRTRGLSYDADALVTDDRLKRDRASGVEELAR